MILRIANHVIPSRNLALIGHIARRVMTSKKPISQGDLLKAVEDEVRFHTAKRIKPISITVR